MSTISEHPLSKKIIVKNTLRLFIIFFVLFIVFYLVFRAIVANPSILQLTILDAVFFGPPFLYFLYQFAHYKSYFYDVRDDFLLIKKGVFNPRESYLPYDKFQDVYIDQDILDRVFKI